MRTTNPNSLAFERPFTIEVTQVNEAQADITLSSATVNKNSVASATVGTLSTTDPDRRRDTYRLVAGRRASTGRRRHARRQRAHDRRGSDFETKSCAAFARIRPIRRGLFFEKAFIIGVANVERGAGRYRALDGERRPRTAPSSTTVGTLSTGRTGHRRVHT